MCAIAVLRHGDAEYQNLEVMPPQRTFHTQDVDKFCNFAKTCKDLKISWLQTLKQNIINFFNKNITTLKDKEIRIWISPLARTVQTANMLVQELLKRWLTIKSISFIDQIQEVKNFDFNIYTALVQGGKITIKKKEIILDKNITNPNNLPRSNYFWQWAHKKINKDYLISLWIYEYIHSIETRKQVITRSQQTLSRVLSASSQNQYTFLVTHQCFSDSFYKKIFPEQKHQATGTFLEINKDELNILLEPELEKT